MPYWLSGFLALSLSQLAVANTDFDLQVCMAHSDRASQLQCCEELKIEESRCVWIEKPAASSETRPPAQDKFFYCKTRDLGGANEDINVWGRGTDFKYMPEKNLWEWRTDYSLRSIDASGGFYETSLIKNGIDRIGDCDPKFKARYEERLKAIKQKFEN